MGLIKFLINPFLLVFWVLFRWIGGAIDRRLGPRSGFVVALALFAGLTGLLAYQGWSLRHELGIVTGLSQPRNTPFVEGKVTAVLGVKERKYTQTQQLIIALPDGRGGVRPWKTNEVRANANALKVGDVARVYLHGQDQEPKLRPEDDFSSDLIASLFGTGLPFILWLLALWYLFVRKSAYQAAAGGKTIHRPGMQNAARPVRAPVVQRGGKLLSTQQRLESNRQAFDRLRRD